MPTAAGGASTTEKSLARVHPSSVFAYDHGDRGSGASAGGSDLRYAPVVAPKARANTGGPGSIHSRALSRGRQGGKAGRIRQGAGGGKAPRPTAAPAIGPHGKRHLSCKGAAARAVVALCRAPRGLVRRLASVCGPLFYFDSFRDFPPSACAWAGAGGSSSSVATNSVAICQCASARPSGQPSSNQM